jgi:hypothetical protein
VRQVAYRLPDLIEAISCGHPLFIVEGEKDVENLRKLGVPATTNAGGAGKWKPELNKFFHNADVIIIADNDPQSKNPKTGALMFHDDGRPVLPGQDHAYDVAQHLTGVAQRVRVLDLGKHWKDCPPKGDISDWIALADGTAEALWQIVDQLPTFDRDKAPDLIPCSVKDTVAVFKKWLALEDVTPVYAVLGAVAANFLPGDPVWLGIIGPPSSAKTEFLNSTSMLPHIFPAAILTLPGLLSGTPKRQRDKGTAGGLLRQIGDFGIILLKDFGSILSMRPDAKQEVLGALREIFDGAWGRDLGTDGGRRLTWHGKIGLVFGATAVIDSHYSVIGAMGDRFLLCRLTPPERGQFKQALKHVGAVTAQMRKELAQAVARLFAGRKAEPTSITDAEADEIDAIISLVVKLRGAVDRDRYKREMQAVLGAEGTARIGLMLERLLAGLDTLGIERTTAMGVVKAVAMDSVPPLRRQTYEYLNRRSKEKPLSPSATTKEVAEVIGLPTITVRRALEDLAAYGVVERSQGAGNADVWLALL